MRRRHMIGSNDKTLCGHDCTVQELRHQKKNKWGHVNCKRCHQQRYKVEIRVSEEDELGKHTIYEYRGNHGSGMP